MKIFNWVHRKFNYKDGIGGNENKNGADTNKHILLEDNELSDMLNGWKGGILTIGTFGFDRNNIDCEEKEYRHRDEDEEDESDVTDESEEEEEEDDEDQESNPLMHAAYAHEFEGSSCDNPTKDTINGTIDSDYDMNMMKKERITLADLFYADSDEQEKYKKSKGKLFEQHKKLSAPESNYKRGRTFAKKLVPRVGEDSRPIKKLHQLMTRILKRKIHPDIGVKINKDNNQNAKPKVAFEDGKIYESISLLHYQDIM